MLFHDRVAVEYVPIGTVPQRLEADWRETVMMAVRASEPIEERVGDGMEDVTMERPFEEAEEQVSGQEGEQ